MGTSAPTKGNGSKRSTAGAHCAPLRRNHNLFGGRPQAAPTEVLQYKGAGGLVRCIFPKAARRAQRRNEVSHKVLCQAFFQESVWDD